ncbi:aspartyl-tRNA(Asn)/glutamyl-tRNA(Gln) amidotransferase subunit A [Micromonospora echinospora]|uniref:Aspartyl-tRNA(Asn)/glutamyl-tRNA(Gln) amidotransferase subunit A n=1 Tax=Micromonospora echinospora TaxID=1877 RepID=A0A1C4Z3S3_MICEC|nr:aspartyl-tRNA(Asn)/glutamyl-tRNA(Gln) amidotransferase subunit A [Micromonospora echinospora]
MTVTELVETSLDRCALIERHVHAFAHIDTARARARAAELDAMLDAGYQPRSPLFGIPLAVKDVIDVAGMPTRAGSRLFSGAPEADHDATVVATLRAAGAVLIGKTHTHEMAMGTVTPTTRNPHDLTRIAGGSSGGSAAAVAAGEVLGALGTDTGGSIRIPAALCGVAGLKPRTHSVDMAGQIPLSPIADSCGPLAANVRDLSVLWSAMSGRPATAVDVHRLGVLSPADLGDVESAVGIAYEQLGESLARHSRVSSVTVQVPAFDEWYPVRLVPLFADAYQAHRAAGWYPAGRGLYSRGLRAVLDAAAKHTAADLLAAWKTLTRLTERLLAAFSVCDALVLPTVPTTAPLRTAVADDSRPRSELTGASRQLTRFCAPVNWSPLAAVTVPFGTDDRGLPVGMQCVALDEERALSAARLVEGLAGTS